MKRCGKSPLINLTKPLLNCGLLTLFLCSTAFSQKSTIRTITISTEPNAIIWLNDVRFGKTDTSGKLIIKTTSGNLSRLRIRAAGFKEITQNLAVTAREVNVKLTKTTDEAELAYQQAESLVGSDREQSAEAYRKAIRLRPRYPEAYLGLARVLSDSGDHEEAAKAIRQAKKLRPGYAEASAVEGRIFRDSGEEEKAIAAFKRSITEGRGFQPEAYTGLGMLYKDRAEAAAGSGDFESETANYNEGAKYFLAAVKQLSGAPDAVVIYQMLGLVYERQKKYAEAIALYEEFLRLYPDSTDATAVRSFIVQIKKQMNEPD